MLVGGFIPGFLFFLFFFLVLSLSATLQNKPRGPPMLCGYLARMEFHCLKLGVNFLVSAEL